jgi:signal transduction histidine kinase
MQQSLATHINHIKDVNAQMEQRNKELLQANQMAEESQRKKNAFVQNMTHQIRTPLNIVLGFAQVMSDNYHAIEAEELKSLNNMVEHNTVLVNRMALMLADSALLDQVTPYPLEDIVSCNDVARETIDFAHHQYPYMNFRLESSLPDTLCIRTNHLFLIRSIRELLINAAKYSNSERVRLKVENSMTRITYTIEDVGPGIPE